jgi:CheY-like chemotaxis protein
MSIVAEREVIIIDDKVTPPLSNEFVTAQLRAALRRIYTLAEADEVLQSGIDAASIIVLDLGFPSDPSEGLRFLRELRRRYPLLTVIVYTNANKIALEEAFHAGATKVLRKNRDPEEFRNALLLASGQKVLQSSVLCEVVAVDTSAVRVRIDGEAGWFAEREFSRSFCPIARPERGATFYLDTFVVPHDGREKFELVARGANPIEQRLQTDALFGAD